MSRTFLLFLFGDLGDTLLAVPAMRALRRRYPQARLLALAKSTPGRVVQDLGLVDGVITVDKHLFDRPSSLLSWHAPRALLRLLREVRRARADTAVLFHHLPSRWGAQKFALLSLATGAKTRVGIDNGRGWFLTSSVDDEGFGARHEAEYFMDVAALLDARGELTLEAPVAPGDRIVAGDLIRDLGLQGKRLAAIHPGTGWYGPGRRWPAERFAQTAHLLQQAQAIEARWVIVGTEQDAGEAAEVAARLGHGAINLVGRTSLGELGALLERCTLLIANDGGVAHLAAAVGTPVVAVFGPSNERAWRPLHGAVVAADLACRPCFYRDFRTGNRLGCATRECLALVTPAATAAAAQRLLNDSP